MRAILAVWAQYLLPQRVLGHLIYRAARCTWPTIKNPLIHWFAKYYRVNLIEAEQSELNAYPTFNDFFTRALRPEVRPLSGDEQTIVSPADGQITGFGSAEAGRLIQAKGLDYSLSELIGEDEPSAVKITLGCFATIYLAPQDYHRVHMPLAGTLKRTRYLPGTRFSVNSRTASRIPNLFVRNERVVCWFDTAIGSMVVVLVGALNVSSITTRWLGEIPSGKQRLWQNDGLPKRHYGRGDEIARFNLGSTVIVLLPPGTITWNRDLSAQRPLLTGQALGRIFGTITDS
jgi:phosphatidylserine decarboxylase